MLHPVKDCPTGRQQWCGPTSLSALTGLSYMDSVAVLKSVRLTRGAYNPIIKGTSTTTMVEALRQLGFITRPTPVLKSKTSAQTETFAAFLRRREGEMMRTPLLVAVTRHYLVVEGRKALDTKSKGEAVFISKIGHRRARMTHAWTVVASGDTARIRRVIASAHVAVELAAAQRQRDRACASWAGCDEDPDYERD